MLSLPKELAQMKIGDARVPRPSYIISLSPFQKIGQAISTMLQAGISSCLVRAADNAEKTPDGSTRASYYCGMIDLLDAVALFGKLYQQECTGTDVSDIKLKSGLDPKYWTKTDDNLKKVKSALDKWNKATVAQLLCDPEFSLHYSQATIHATLQGCAQQLGPNKFSRLLIIDDDFNVVNIITQTALNTIICSQLADDPELFKKAEPFLNLPLSQLLVERPNPGGGASNPTLKTPLIDPSPNSLFTVKDTDLAITAFNAMWTKHVSGVAVIDKHGGLIGNISLRDIRALVSIHDQFAHLSLTALEYLCLIKKEREENSSKLYIKHREYQKLQDETNAAAGEQIVLSDDQSAVVLGKKSEESPSDPHFDNTTAMLRAHAALSPTLTFNSEDTVGHTLFSFHTNHVRRLYMTSGRAVPIAKNQIQLVSLPVSIITLSNVCEILGGDCSTLSF